MSNKTPVQLANAAYKKGDFDLALKEYEKASKLYGAKFFTTNISLCQKKLFRNFQKQASRKYGVSVIIPSCKGEATIEKCLKSIVNQTLDSSFYEVILIINGDKDGTIYIAEKLKSQYVNFNFKILASTPKGVGNARNLGVKNASYQYLTFIDDDDYVSERYLEGMLSFADENSIVFAQIIDDKDGVLSENKVNSQLKNFEYINSVSYNDISSIITLNACKLVHYNFLENIEYDNQLRSGEDVVYWLQVISENIPSIKIIPFNQESIYFRTLRENSLSRRPESYEFNIIERLEVVRQIYIVVKKSKNKEVQEFAISKIRAQLGFCINYLKRNKEEFKNFIIAVDRLKLDSYVLRYVNKKISENLVISYCFPPYVDTAGVVTAKRIWENGNPVDVISNQMDKIRKKELSLFGISENLIGESIVLSAPAAFSNWNAIKVFAEQALLAIEKQEQSKGFYKSVYSRAMWPGSHFAAACYKAKRSEVKWIAEFSDPLLINIDGNDRKDPLEIKHLKALGIIDYLISNGLSVPNDPRLFYWCEYLPYVMADELIFTNENQLIYMLDNFPDKDIIRNISHKFKIKPQPTLNKKFYNIVNTDYKMDINKINIGYFGAFYSKRGLDEVFNSFMLLDSQEKLRFHFHIFTEQGEKIKLLENYDKIKNFITVSDYIPYLDFLNLCTKMSILFVNDSITNGFKNINPYLPSKLSDYLGSEVPIWAACEKDSILYKIMSLNDKGFTSIIKNETSYLKVLRSMLE